MSGILLVETASNNKKKITRTPTHSCEQTANGFWQRVIGWVSGFSLLPSVRLSVRPSRMSVLKSALPQVANRHRRTLGLYQNESVSSNARPFLICLEIRSEFMWPDYQAQLSPSFSFPFKMGATINRHGSYFHLLRKCLQLHPAR